MERRGPIAWMASNPIAASLLMLLLLLGGLAIAPQLKQEVFPEVTLDVVTITVPYPGASPEEVEEGVILAVEDAVRGIEGVDVVRATANEGVAVVTAELLAGANANQALNDIESAVNRITSFPSEAEEPVISLASNRREVVSLILYGQVDEQTLHQVAESLRRALLRRGSITQVEISGLPEPEISIEVPRSALRKHNLTLTDIAAALGRASIDLPGGEIRARSGDVLVRTREQRRVGPAFERATVLQSGAARVTVGDIATVRDSFAEIDREAYYNGQRAARLDVFRVGEQSPIEVSRAVHELAEQARPDLPRGMKLAVWNDFSQIYRDRRDLLIDNAMWGGALVVLLLGLVLRPRIAFWVTIGIPVSFLGAFWVMPALGVSINMISMFGFLLTLGIVVDDAIVVGEAAFKQRREGMPPLQAAIDGVREVRTPVVFAVLTSITAFVPLLFVPGVIGKLIDNIPLIVIPILAISLLESLFILPAHIGHRRRPSPGRLQRLLARIPDRVAPRVERFADGRLRRWVDAALRWRYVTLAAGVALLLAALGTVAGKHITFRFLPKIEGDLVIAQVEMPVGTPVERTRRVLQKLVGAAHQAAGELGEPDEILRGIYAELGRSGAAAQGPSGGEATSGAHLAEVSVLMTPAQGRTVTAAALTRRWRAITGEIAGAQTLTFQYNIGPPAGAAVALELSHDDLTTLENAAEDLAAQLRRYRGVVDVSSGVERGKQQIDLHLTEDARSLGIDEASLAQQVRAAFYGAEVERQQRERHELRVYVRLPRSQRSDLRDLYEYRIRGPKGAEIPLREAALLEQGRSYTAIGREQGRRIIEVTADVEPEVTTGGEVTEHVIANVMPQLMKRYPGLTYERGGEQEERQESLAALARNFPVALLAMYILLAVVFRSYWQPILILAAIPFGIIGALIGHLLMGFELSIISVFGLIALSGVVVNDSLVLMATVNRYRAQGRSAHDAALDAASRRFRPIVLTSLTTFLGLAPMIFETSVQAKFLIPMAISLGFGVLFVTPIALFLVPAAYLAVEDLRRALTLRS